MKEQKEYRKNNNVSIDIDIWEASVLYEVKLNQEKLHSVAGSLHILHPKSEEIIHHFDSGTYKFSTLLPGTELYDRIIVPDGFTLCDLSMSLDNDKNHSDESTLTSMSRLGYWSLTSGEHYHKLTDPHMGIQSNRLKEIEVPSDINVLVKEVQIPSYLRREIRNANDSFMNHLFGEYLLDE